MAICLCKSLFVAKSFLQNLQGSERIFKRIHLKIRSDPCKFCRKDFATNKDLQRHIAIVHEKTLSFPCEICHRELSSGSKLNKHIKEVHKITK